MRLLVFASLLFIATAHGKELPNVDLLLVAADDSTLAPVLARLENLTTSNHAAWTCWTGTIGNKALVVTRTEGDPLNAVAATTHALRLCKPRLVFVFGVARRHDPSLRTGDIVLSTAFAAFDGIVSPPAPLGGGTHPLTWHALPHALMHPGEQEIASNSFPADASARALALSLKVAEGRLVEGVLGSSAQINREADRITYLRSVWHTSTEDEESAHVAGCAALFGVPVFGARVVNGTPAAAAEFALQFVAHWK
ncbi:MAG: hypothetical protein ABIZ04_11170 [Opitutus sp.]